MSAPVILRTAIGDYPHVRALRDGRVASPRLAFDFVSVAPITRAFRRMVRELAFDLCEMALTTLAQARARFGADRRPRRRADARLPSRRAGLPARQPDRRAGGPAGQADRRARLFADHRRLGARHPAERATASTRRDRPGSRPGRRACRRIPRSALRDPRTPPAQDLRAMLLRDGEIDAGIALTGLDRAGSPHRHSGCRRTPPPPGTAAPASTPSTTLVAARPTLLAAHPWLAAELMTLFAAAKAADPPPPHPLVDGDPLPTGWRRTVPRSRLLTPLRRRAGTDPRAASREDLFAA